MDKEAVLLQYDINLAMLHKKWPESHVNKVTIEQGAHILGVHECTFRNCIAEYGYIHKTTTLMKLTIAQCRETTRSLASQSWEAARA